MASPSVAALVAVDWHQEENAASRRGGEDSDRTTTTHNLSSSTFAKHNSSCSGGGGDTTDTSQLDAFELLRRVIGEPSVGQPVMNHTNHQNLDKSETLSEMIESAQVAITRQDNEAHLVRSLTRKEATTSRPGNGSHHHHHHHHHQHHNHNQHVKEGERDHELTHGKSRRQGRTRNRDPIDKYHSSFHPSPNHVKEEEEEEPPPPVLRRRLGIHRSNSQDSAVRGAKYRRHERQDRKEKRLRSHSSDASPTKTTNITRRSSPNPVKLRSGRKPHQPSAPLDSRAAAAVDPASKTISSSSSSSSSPVESTTKPLRRIQSVPAPHGHSRRHVEVSPRHVLRPLSEHAPSSKSMSRSREPAGQPSGEETGRHHKGLIQSLHPPLHNANAVEKSVTQSKRPSSERFRMKTQSSSEPSTPKSRNHRPLSLSPKHHIKSWASMVAQTSKTSTRSKKPGNEISISPPHVGESLHLSDISAAMLVGLEGASNSSSTQFDAASLPAIHETTSSQALPTPAWSSSSTSHEAQGIRKSSPPFDTEAPQHMASPRRIRSRVSITPSQETGPGGGEDPKLPLLQPSKNLSIARASRSRSRSKSQEIGSLSASIRRPRAEDGHRNKDRQRSRSFGKQDESLSRSSVVSRERDELVRSRSLSLSGEHREDNTMESPRRQARRRLKERSPTRKVMDHREPSSTAHLGKASPSRLAARIRLPVESFPAQHDIGKMSPIGKHGGLLVRRRESIEMARSPRPSMKGARSVDISGGEEQIRSPLTGPATTHVSSIGVVASLRESIEKTRSARALTGDDLKERDRSQRTIHATSPTGYIGTVARLRESMPKQRSARVLRDQLTLLDGTEEKGQDVSERTSDSIPIGGRSMSTRRNRDILQHPGNVDAVKPRRDITNSPLLERHHHSDPRQREEDEVAEESLSELVKKAKMRKKRTETAQRPERSAEAKVEDVVW